MDEMVRQTPVAARGGGTESAQYSASFNYEMTEAIGFENIVVGAQR